MKAKFKTAEDEKRFKEYVCNNKEVLQGLLAFGSVMTGPILKIIFKSLGDIIKVACPEKKNELILNPYTMKHFLASKLNWLGIIAALVGLEDFIKNYNFADITLKGWVTFGLGVTIVIVRTYFTSKAIGK